ncbi:MULTISPECIES: beta-N-acetylhexosaminidase [Kitasatospora]|uniref:beta-N-acetylhexosaminidase n=1 Tax=Kitasatospora setae (strain ATCC 33774 / DSM 43861 / JCM 3304 / KCC A-0304 / NBRC 14216 / KM-6054) TaxID=452652 RepID=E4NBV6_KITSK|nr:MULTISPECIES: beta-N-acetylhexosaminidase [Kitasatospora]BAJ28687.1 putative beta-N-acetylhexosaminidase [Kitasatospora setae KM-6054]
MDLIPAPSHVQAGPDAPPFVLHAGSRIAAAPGTAAAARRLRAELSAATGFDLDPAPAGQDGDLRLDLDPALGAEEYRLSADAESVRLTAGGPAGLGHAVQTLRQLLGPAAYRTAPLPGASWTVPAVEIRDAPRFGWRGAMLDVSRHFMPKAGVLRFVDQLAAHKLNVLHFHLTDDQGWRFEVKRYPRLTEVGGWRERSMVGYRAGNRRDDQPHGGYYTQDDLREIVAYAAARGVTVVPEIDLPGHNQAAVAAYPELGNTDVVDTAALGTWTDWGVSENILNPSEATLRFYEHVLEELLEVFPSTFVHLGGDECPKDQWKQSPAAQARIAELGLKDEFELQSHVIRHFDGWLAARGRRLIGWDEILEGGLAPGAAVSSWRGYDGGIAAANAGHDVVMCPEQHVYLDHRQADGDDEPIPVGWVRTLEDVYRFEPVPPQLDEAAAAHVIGTQANLWTEFMYSGRDVDYKAFPRLAALAEVAWSDLPRDPAARDWAGFERRMATHYLRLEALGVEYRHPDGPRPWQRKPGIVGRPLAGKPGPSGEGTAP